ncbi:MAG: pyridoxal 5'-phosphate synthase glutaminase subunit PdxT [Gammaproteobacteria bacterium]|nr:pyridoxal 5'-phosphate synthase glutaminase subunit PdxT [Gammaproteobacteria bacterium]
MTIGVLALQGAFIEHIGILQNLGAATREIRLPEDLEGIDGLIIPGGESTTISKLMQDYSLITPIKKMAKSGLPVWGTCAGLILLAKKIDNQIVTSLDLMDIEVTRNAFGRQKESFSTGLSSHAIGDKQYEAVFIRAPLISDTGKKVEVLAKLEDGTIVAARENNLLVTSFHPELTLDHRWHQYFLSMINK